MSIPRKRFSKKIDKTELYVRGIIMTKNFTHWLNQPVTFSSGTQISRIQYIGEFANDIRSFANRFGYKFVPSWNPTLVARWLYTLHIRHATGDTSEFPYEEIEHRDTIDDRAHYSCIIQEDDLDEMFSKWNNSSDLSIHTDIGVMVRDSLLRFMWNYIDLDISYQGQLVASILYSESDSDSDTNEGKRSDYYTKDAAEGYHG